ncbi:M1 family metallopeptidase [Hyphobacterium sp. CCMP332]|nr:M1 family metallopeptidase [Hyphobacterium sp. CCMP332]
MKKSKPEISAQKALAKKVELLEEKPLQIQDQKIVDILHTELQLSFDWQKQEVGGLAVLTIKPNVKDIKEFYLDAKSMEILNVSIKPLDRFNWQYNYRNDRIYFKVDTALNKYDVLTINIAYRAKPNRFYDSLSPEDKGLFFVDPLDTIQGISPQIWTQGETSYNSVWFPTLDRPDEKFTQDIYLTVDTSMVTLSNGKLKAKTFNENGTRTDHWSQQLPHSAYLTMIAVGSWKILELKSESVPLYVYTEREYENSMDDVFANTSEMINFYSSLFNYPFPWEKYAQIPVRQFITGAMENTSASVFMSNLYVDKKELTDENFDWIISHELVHQWFGDLVTCESWPYVSLNESFANYGEYLWSEYKYGEEAAALVRLAELDDYFSEARDYRAPIIRHRYDYAGDLFDAHSYSKGGFVIHMLRKELGDDLFFEGISVYLKKFKYQNVELSDLRKVFEDLSGKDLHYFFEQWFERPGHPQLKIKYEEMEPNILGIEINQIQKEDAFRIPLKLRYLYRDRIPFDTVIVISQKSTNFKLELEALGGTLIADPDHNLLIEVSIKKTYDELVLQYYNSNDFLNRYDAFMLLRDSFPERVKSTGISQVFLLDSSYTIQELTLDFIEREYDIIGADTKRRIIEIAKTSNKSYVRGAALETLMYIVEPDTIFYEAFLKDSSWYVNAIALDALIDIKKDSAEKMEIVQAFEESNNPHVLNVVASYYASLSIDKSDWFKEKLNIISDQNKYAILGYYGLGMLNADSVEQQQALNLLYNIATNDKYSFNRVMAYQSLLVYLDRPLVKKQLIDILKKEDSDAIRKWFSNML